MSIVARVDPEPSAASNSWNLQLGELVGSHVEFGDADDLAGRVGIARRLIEGAASTNAKG